MEPLSCFLILVCRNACFRSKCPLSVTYFKGVNFNPFCCRRHHHIHLSLFTFYWLFAYFFNQYIVLLEPVSIKAPHVTSSTFTITTTEYTIPTSPVASKTPSNFLSQTDEWCLSYNTDSLCTTFSCSMAKACAIKTYALLFQNASPVV